MLLGPAQLRTGVVCPVQCGEAGGPVWLCQVKLMFVSYS